MRGKAMEKICNKLQQKNIDLRTFDALEFFARAGDWQTIKYASQVKSLDAWEVDSRFENALKQNLPNARITIGDSFDLATRPKYHNLYDFIVIDNPQNVFGDKNQYCEHFDVLPLVKNLLRDNGVMIYNVNTAPFNYDDFPLWEERRNKFYNVDKTQYLTDQFIYEFYHNFWTKIGFKVEFQFKEQRNDEYLAYVVTSVRKVA